MGQFRHAQRGQTLLVVVFAMSLGLLVVVNTAARALSSVARTTQTNFFQKATMAAEAGNEVFLAKTFSDLDSLHSTCPTSAFTALAFPDNIPAACIVNFTEARALMGVETFPQGTESFELKSEPGEIIHLNLQDLSGANVIRVCWRGLGSRPYSVSHYFMYHGLSGSYEVKKDVYKCHPSFTLWCNVPGGNVSSDLQQAPQADGDYSCYQVDVPADPLALRIFTFPDGGYYKISALNISALGGISPRPLPAQGYRIVAIGEVVAGGGGALESKKATRKKVLVEKTFPYPAGPWWDFAVASITGEVASN
ncbi:hypothetical protein KJ605_02230 [Patescibacteria group bacterium]|nr:hypothetical protein [Patescibacteria group bacterium]